MPTRKVDLRESRPVPLEFAGKWVAWSSDHSRILAHSESMQDLWRMVHDDHVPDPIFEKVPRSDVRLIGMR